MKMDAVKRHGDPVVIRVSGNLDDPAGAKALYDRMREAYESGEARVHLDLREVRSINWHGIGKMLLFCKRLRERGGDLTLGQMQDGVKAKLDGLMITDLLGDNAA